MEDLCIDANIIQAKNGVEVLERLELFKDLPFIIFLDVNMPLMDGLTALGVIRANKKYNPIPVIIFSTTANPIGVNDAYRLGANLYLRKPNQYSDYINIIKALVTGENNPDTLHSFIQK